LSRARGIEYIERGKARDQLLKRPESDDAQGKTGHGGKLSGGGLSGRRYLLSKLVSVRNPANTATAFNASAVTNAARRSPKSIKDR